MQSTGATGEIIYGIDGLTDLGVFLPRSDAEAFQRLGDLRRVSTWGEVRSILPADQYLDVKSMYAFEGDQDPDAYEPPDGEQFAMDNVGLYAEGEWPVA